MSIALLSGPCVDEAAYSLPASCNEGFGAMSDQQLLAHISKRPGYAYQGASVPDALDKLAIAVMASEEVDAHKNKRVWAINRKRLRLWSLVKKLGVAICIMVIVSFALMIITVCFASAGNFSWWLGLAGMMAGFFSVGLGYLRGQIFGMQADWAEWKERRLSEQSYQGFIPREILLKAAAIRQKCPHTVFFLEELYVNKVVVDPLIYVEDVSTGEIFCFGQWD